MNRREFLKLLSWASTGVLLESCGLGETAPSSQLAFALEQLENSLDGNLIFPSQQDYEKLSYQNNGRYRYTIPIAVAECVSSNDISTCILWAIANNIGFAPRSGGHNFAGYSATSGLLISLTNMKEIQLNADIGVITVGPGVQNRDLAKALSGGNWVLPAGTCPQVGISGLTLGGGLGYNARWGGTTADNLISTTMVLADGKQVTASSSQNTQLFWACKGAAGRNFGINSSFTFQLQPVPRSEVMVFGFEFIGLEQLIEGVSAWNTVFQSAPSTLSGAFITRSSTEKGVQGLLFGQFIGTQSDGVSLLEPVYAAHPNDNYVETLPWWDAQKFLTDPDTIVLESYWSRNRFISTPLTMDNITDMLTHLAGYPNSNNQYGQVDFIGWTGGAVNTVPASATAFVHRNTQGIVRFNAKWPYTGSTSVPSEINIWMEQLWALSASTLSNQSYQNFPDPQLTDWQNAYYGANFSTLTQVKQMYDPNNVFSYPQSIPL